MRFRFVCALRSCRSIPTTWVWPLPRPLACVAPGALGHAWRSEHRDLSLSPAGVEGGYCKVANGPAGSVGSSPQKRRAAPGAHTPPAEWDSQRGAGAVLPAAPHAPLPHPRRSAPRGSAPQQKRTGRRSSPAVSVFLFLFVRTSAHALLCAALRPILSRSLLRSLRSSFVPTNSFGSFGCELRMVLCCSSPHVPLGIRFLLASKRSVSCTSVVPCPSGTSKRLG